jgi:hypothetical protein
MIYSTNPLAKNPKNFAQKCAQISHTILGHFPIKKARNLLELRAVFGGDKQDRTADLLHAMQALSQLSYTPKLKICEDLNVINGKLSDKRLS